MLQFENSLWETSGRAGGGHRGEKTYKVLWNIWGEWKMALTDLGKIAEAQTRPKGGAHGGYTLKARGEGVAGGD